jgi:excisionase family DNA binding protein
MTAVPSWMTALLSLQEAAERLGVSERTVQRRIAKGTVQAYKTDTPRGQVWRVILDSPVVPHDSTQNGAAVVHDSISVTHDSTPPATPAPDLDRLVDLVDRLTRDNQQLAGQLGFVQAKLQAAEEQIRLLSVPKDAPAPAAEPAPVQRAPWWRRLLE